MKNYVLKLQLFADGAGAGTGAGEGAEAGTAAENNAGVAAPEKGRKNDLSNVKYGKQETQSDDYSAAEKGLPGKEVSTQEAAERATAFENMIKGEYKDEFNSRVQKIVQGRIGDTKALQAQVDEMKSAMEILSARYGVDATDTKALVKAIEADDSLYEAEATRRGMSVEQYKKVRELEKNNRELEATVQTMQRQKEGEQIYGKWMNEAEALQEKYGIQNFDFGTEAQNPEFLNLLKSGVSVESAYKAIHFDDMVGGAMMTTAQQVSQKMAQNIASRASRPMEGAVSSQPGVITKTDVTKLTKADREEIDRRVARGEKISF